MVPRVQTFGWRFLSKAMPTGARAGKYSKHINKLCNRCGVEEDDLHLFFTCGFSKAAWFSDPWFIRTEVLISNADTRTEILKKIINLNHPHANLNNVLTFMWCIWKARNDSRFNGKECHPKQIQHMANAINQNLEKVNILQDQANRFTKNNICHENQHTAGHQDDLTQGEMIKSDLLIHSNKIYTDVAWKTSTDVAWKTRKAPGLHGRITLGIGVFCHLQHDSGESKVIIQASMPKALSPLVAEADALIFAAQLAQQMNIPSVTFLIDNLTLARAVASVKISDATVPWELRQQIAHYKKVSRDLEANIYHIKRDINGIAHDCSQQALRQNQSMPISSCTSSAHYQNNCPLVLALQNIHMQGIGIHAVHCF
jgi:hypothetical protein